MVSPSPSSPLATWSMRASANLLRLASPRHIFIFGFRYLQHLFKWQLDARCWTGRPRTRPFWTQSLPRQFSPGLEKPLQTSLLMATTVEWVFYCCCCCRWCCSFLFFFLSLLISMQYWCLVIDVFIVVFVFFYCHHHQSRWFKGINCENRGWA